MHELLRDAGPNDLEQAIIYRGGESGSRSRVLSLPAEQRHALIEFLKTP